MNTLHIAFLCVLGFSNYIGIPGENIVTTNPSIRKEQEAKHPPIGKKCLRVNSNIKQCATDIIVKKDVTFREQPLQIEKLGFLQENNDSREYNENEESTTYYSIGAFMLGKQKGELYLVSAIDIYSPSKLYFAQLNGKYYFLDSISTDFGGNKIHTSNRLFSKKITKEQHSEISTLIQQYFSLPKSISFSKNNKNYSLKLQKNETTPFSSHNFEKAPLLDGDFYIETRKPHKWGSDSYRKYDKIRNTNYKAFDKLEQSVKDKYFKENNNIRTFSTKGIYKKLPDGTIAIYNLEIPFNREDKDGEEKLDIQIENGERGKWYHSQNTSGCGGLSQYAFDLQGNFTLSVMNPEAEKDKSVNRFTDITISYTDKDLVVIGKTGTGENIYGFGDNNHPFLQGLYKGHLTDMDMKGNDLYVNNEKIVALDYKTFVNRLPIFFWDDPFGRRLAFIKWNTVMHLEMACGAKPVIYLYPEKKQNVTISLDWKKKELISIPKYKNAWNVQADVNGNISYQGKNYPYLFWEDSLVYKKKTDGFVVPKENIAIFLDEKLSILGLNEKEKADFTEFWLEKLQKKPYYFIRFYENETMDKVAPITVIPKPDSIQRIFMDYQGLDEPIQVTEQQLTPFKRTGFSVIEWGGNLQK